MTAYWEIVALSAYDMFSKYKYLNVNLVLFTPRFGVRIYFLVQFTEHCLILFFSPLLPTTFHWIASTTFGSLAGALALLDDTFLVANVRITSENPFEILVIFYLNAIGSSLPGALMQSRRAFFLSSLSL